jgi:hypothetical protein
MVDLEDECLAVLFEALDKSETPERIPPIKAALGEGCVQLS